MDETRQQFEQLIADSERAVFEGWDFSYLEGRWFEGKPPWSYPDLVRERLASATAVLDMETGGGEFLASLAPLLPGGTWATEAYPSNIPVARRRLEPLGIQVAAVESDDQLPFGDGAFDLVINRHGSFDAREVGRVLRPGGRFVTQQVGGKNCIGLNELLGGALPPDLHWGLRTAVGQLEAVGLRTLRAEESAAPATVMDVGAIVYYLKAIPWQIPDFDLEQNREQLYAIWETIRREGPLKIESHRFIIEAVK